MTSHCVFSKGNHCLKWVDYQTTRYELEEADELCQAYQDQIIYLQKRVCDLEQQLKDHGITIPDPELDDC